MAQYKLHYFDARGRGEPTRLCFAAAGVEYEDIRYKGEEWQAKKKKEVNFTPNGVLPMLELADGRKLSESTAIIKYVACELGLAPTDCFGVAQCDMLVAMVDELIGKMIKFHFEKDEERKKTFKEEFDKTHLPTFLEKINNVLKANNCGKRFFVGNKLSYGDLIVFNTCGMLSLENGLDDYPELKGHYVRIGEIPNIKDWIEKRPKTEM